MIANWDLNKEICEALGLDPTKTKAFTLTLAPDSAPLVEVVQFVHVEEGKKLAEVLKRYRLKAEEATS